MKLVAICLHCLDMRDFHSNLRDTPFLDRLRSQSIFIPMGRGQGHHQGDSLNAEMTGIWTASCSDSVLDEEGYHPPTRCNLPKTLIERFFEAGRGVFTCIGLHQGFGTWAVGGGMRGYWLKEQPERMAQFNLPHPMGLAEWLRHLNTSEDFYAHLFLRNTHRPWSQETKLFSLLGRGVRTQRWIRKKRGRPSYWPDDAYVARRAALERPDEFAALRRAGLAMSDRVVAEIFEATKDIPDLAYVVYSNHGEVLDHFRYNLAYRASVVDGLRMVEGTSHGLFPYEVLYSNMQMWVIPGHPPTVMRGIGRSIDFAPTVLELAGIDYEGMHGESMLGYFSAGEFPAWDRYAESPFGGGCLSMVRKDGFKLISIGTSNGGEGEAFAQRGFPDHSLAVFDLVSDPYEYVNLIQTDRGEEVLRWAISRHRALKLEAKQDQ